MLYSTQLAMRMPMLLPVVPDHWEMERAHSALDITATQMGSSSRRMPHQLSATPKTYTEAIEVQVE